MKLKRSTREWIGASLIIYGWVGIISLAIANIHNDTSTILFVFIAVSGAYLFLFNPSEGDE